MVIIASNDAMKKNQLSSMTQVGCARKSDPTQDIRKQCMCEVTFDIKDFQGNFLFIVATDYYVNDECKVSLKVFKIIKHLWVLKFHKNNAFSAIASNGIIIGV